jgi:UDP-N-acetyl-D-mannosaminuronic acid dehydrogenase
MKTDICIIGMGYIGLPTAVMFASKGYDVFGVDVCQEVVDKINLGQAHICEPGLAELVKSAVAERKLCVGLVPVPAKNYIIAVPTPFKKLNENSRIPDLGFVESASRAIAPHVEEGDLVVLESTSPVGTTEKICNWIIDERSKYLMETICIDSIYFAHCPERVLPGQMMRELVENDRIIGGLTEDAAIKARNLYSIFCNGNILLTTARTAEMVKLTENSFRDVNIAFANELSMICDQLELDVWEVISLANRHPRVKILQPGPGVGGHCIAVDPWFIVDSSPELARLIRVAREVNEFKPFYVFEIIKKQAEQLDSPTITVLGLAFKADVDDLRESPALEIVKLMVGEHKYKINIVEPYISSLPKDLASIISVRLMDADAAINESQMVVLLVNHRQFTNIDKSLLTGKILVDTRGVLL